MARTSGPLTLMGAAARALFSNLGTAGPVLVAYALLSSAGTSWVLKAFPPPTSSADQGAMVYLLLGMLGVWLGLEVFIAPAIGAIAVYIGRQHSAGESSSLYRAFNFAILRYRRMFLPHAGAWLSIQVGLQIILLPGILFWMMYAFVDPIACLENERWPMARSKKLTKGVRKTLFLLILPYLVMMIAWTVVGLMAGSEGFLVLFASELLRLAVLFWVFIGCYLLYEERAAMRRKKKPALRAEAVKGASIQAVEIQDEGDDDDDEDRPDQG